MTLDVQIISLVFSYSFGIFFSLFLNLNHKIIFNSHKFIKILGTSLVVLISNLTYFIILMKINNAIFHPYELLMIILGFYSENKVKQLSKKKNHIVKK